MYNPQFPHTLRVIREGLDEHGDPITDENGDPVAAVVTLTAVVMVDNQPTFDADGKFITEEVDSIPFGYRQSSMNTMRAGDVIVSDYKISCPIFLTPLNPGDILEIRLGRHRLKAKILEPRPYAKKEDAATMYEIIEDVVI